MDNESLVSSPSCVLVDDLSITHLESFIDTKQDSLLSSDDSLLNTKVTRDDSLAQQVTGFFHRDSLSQLGIIPDTTKKTGTEPLDSASIPRQSLSRVSLSSIGYNAHESGHNRAASNNGWDSKRCSNCDTTHCIADNSSYRRTIPVQKNVVKARSRIPRFRSDLLDIPLDILPNLPSIRPSGSYIPTFSKLLDWNLLY